MSDKTRVYDSPEKKMGKAALIWRFLRGSKTFFLLGVIFTLLTALNDMVIPQIIRVTVDNVVGSSPADLPAFIMNIIDMTGGFEFLRKNLWIMALAVVFFALIKVISQYLYRVFNTKGSETLVKTTRDSLFSHIERLPYSWHMKNHTGDIIQRCTSDIDVMSAFVSDQMTTLLRTVILLVFSLAFMFGMNVPLTFAALAPVPFILVNSFVFHRKMSSKFEMYDSNEGKVSSIVQENLTGVRVVKAFGREKEEKDKFHAHNNVFSVIADEIGRKTSWFWCTADVLSGLQIMLVIVVGAVFCIKDYITPGEYIAFISYNATLSWPIERIGRLIADMSKTGVSVDRIRYIMNSACEKDSEKALTPSLDRDIEFDNVSFAYENAPETIKNVSFTMKAGTTLGILGGTGSGKSTLMLLLDKLYDLGDGCGSIKIGGVDIRDIDTGYLRKNIGMVLQDPFLFSKTIAENISVISENTDMDKIREAAEDACLDETVSSFSKGYDTFVGERGVTLSGGQKQRTAIARILMQDTPIMIFDDSLSAVDTETDARIRSSLEKRFGSASIIIISHRITTLSKADKIIVLDRGSVAEEGSHAELIAKNGIYRRIYDIQSLKEEDIK